MYRVYWNQAAALICPFISSFSFVSSFHTLKCFVTLFSGTVRPGRLIHGTHVDSGQMYCVYRNQLLLLIRSFISSFYFLPNFQTLELLITLFSGTVRPRRLKLCTHVNSWQMYRAYRNQATADYLTLYFFSFLSNFQMLTLLMRFAT